MVALGERSTPNGQELLAEFIQYGQQRPFEEIVRRYAGMVFNVCYRITKDKHEAEDATQAVFLTLALQAKRGADIKALGPWLQQVAKRLALDTRRSKKRRHTREERHHVEQTIRRESLMEDTLPSADLDELKTVLHEELQKLPAKYRLPLILHYFGGLNREEMAAELNCKPSTLGVRIFRGREMLAGRLSSRGINISAGALAVALGFVVKRAVSETLISSTSYAATAMMHGHDGAGFASAHVIGLTRRASSAMVIGKVKIAAMTLLLAGTSLGAGAKVLGILPQIDVRRIITHQLERLVSPLLGSFNHPLRVDAQASGSKTTVAVATPAAQVLDLSNAGVHLSPSNIALTSPQTNRLVVAPNAVAVVATATKSETAPLLLSTIHWSDSTVAGSANTDHSATTAAKSTDVSDAPAITAASSGAVGGGGSGGISDYHLAAALPSRATVDTYSIASDVVVSSTNNLVVGSPKAATGTGETAPATSSDPSASPAALIQIASIGGSVTESSTGVLRGWGTIDRTGTLENNGRVAADGQGVDRTLNLTSMTSVETGIASTSASAPVVANPSASNSSLASASSSSTGSKAAQSAGTMAAAGTAPNGWYAINHGRLSLPLLANSNDPTTLTWGDNPDGKVLSLVNSVRVALAFNGIEPGTTQAVPTTISLLSTERADAPNLSEIGGATIGLWQVDPSGPDLASADLTVHYDPLLVDELGAPDSSINLWTYSDQTDSWQSVDPSTFALDSTNDLVSGYGTDISYFAVSVDATHCYNVDELVADHLAQTSGQSGGTITGVPEPVVMPIVLTGITLLGRRRRRSSAPSSST